MAEVAEDLGEIVSFALPRPCAHHPYRALERGQAGDLGWRILYFPRLDSTQRIAAELARQSQPAGTLVIAESQSSGRGRSGHHWFSPPGVNLYLTAILRPQLDGSRLPSLSLAAGLAMAQALAEVVSVSPRLKWPNDLWFGERKAGGLLAEVIGHDTGAPCVLLGLGLNVNLRREQLPPALLPIATSLRIETGREWDRAAILGGLIRHLSSCLAEWERDGFAPMAARWRTYSVLTGRRVSLREGAASIQGQVMGIDDRGALLVDTGSEVRAVMAGEVMLE
ncbi:MAG TPA: biotin--[acetyl-CoA-carboxylase] ligase [Candidatus Binataceae bacterium]|nr:biotin--[acetyl-CoA-carboxylase] ligase [Candidatus Binataceae bacterium]